MNATGAYAACPAATDNTAIHHTTDMKDTDMNEHFDDYTKATFPFEVKWGGYGTVRLLAAFVDKVVGVTYYTDIDGKEHLRQCIDWDGNGVFAGGKYPAMDLPPPPAVRARHVAAWQNEHDAIKDRLNAFPEAPAEWRTADERKLQALARKIEEAEA